MGTVPRPLDKPSEDDFTKLDHNHIQDLEGLMLPPTKPTDLPWPRDTPKEDVTPLWGPQDCKNLTPVVQELCTVHSTTKRKCRPQLENKLSIFT